MYLEKSMTTATLQHWPAQAGAAAARQDRRAELVASATVCTTSSLLRGTTTPMGACR